MTGSQFIQCTGDTRWKCFYHCFMQARRYMAEHLADLATQVWLTPEVALIIEKLQSCTDVEKLQKSCAYNSLPLHPQAKRKRYLHFATWDCREKKFEKLQTIALIYYLWPTFVVMNYKSICLLSQISPFKLWKKLHFLGSCEPTKCHSGSAPEFIQSHHEQRCRLVGLQNLQSLSLSRIHSGWQRCTDRVGLLIYSLQCTAVLV